MNMVMLKSLPVLKSGFRPFNLLAFAYGPLMLMFWLAALGIFETPLYPDMYLWHGHEMLFGFSAAIVSSFILTALPGWVGTEEIQGPRLACLVVTWLAGRLFFWLSPIVPLPLIAVIDCSYFILLGVFLLPGLLRAPQKRYLMLIPILASFALAHVWFYSGVIQLDFSQSHQALRLALYTLMVLFSIVGGFLIPVFTETYLLDKGWQGKISFVPVLDILSVIAVILFAVTGVIEVQTQISMAVALLAFGINLLRMSRWRSRLTLGEPVIWAMHLAYFWLLLCFLARAVGEFTGSWPASTALHLFFVGSFGLMTLSLMSRVALRHTGRPFVLPAAMRLAIWLMLLAAILRFGAVEPGMLYKLLSIASAICWSVCWILYLSCFARMLLTPSLPRQETPVTGSS